ncbi:hypothetical protein [Streptomyces sp. NPDC047973]|uniref:hypothetical protein n=1 Tax=Streptomyces sp. NPDC047973 TaxID=3155383 RepID=UPI003430DF0A
MPQLRSAVHSARDRNVLPQFRPDGNIRMMARALDLSAPISVRSLIQLLDSLHLTPSTQPSPGDHRVTPPPPVRPDIDVDSAGSGSGASFTVTGSGFLPDHDVRIRVVALVPHEVQVASFNRTTDSAGALPAGNPEAIACVSGTLLHFSATDGRTVPPSVDLTGFLWSDTVHRVCP